MPTFGKSSRQIAPEELRVNSSARPGWVSGADRLPAVGDQVQCTEGVAEVVRILGKTGNGSRLLELCLPGRPREPFFAAASNVLVPPRAAA